MRIGVLTFHSQLNYGGVLQCWALQTALTRMGHEVLVIDRDFEDRRSIRKLCKRRTWREKLRSRIASLYGSNCELIRARSEKTFAFLNEQLNLTPFHFVDWQDAPRDLNFDLIVVGSDQVWHSGNWGDPRPYLLEGAPSVNAIAYAASFGMESVPSEFRQFYERGFKRFSSISVREQSACKILQGFGVDAHIVLDPTLLIEQSAWEWLCRKRKQNGERKIACYFVDAQEDDLREEILRFQKCHGCRIDVFMNLQIKHRVSFRKPFKILDVMKERYASKVAFRYDAAPGDFITAIREADLIVTDSFHAVMFSTIFAKNVRVIRPTVEWLQMSFSRISDFVDQYVSGPIFVDTLKQGLEALDVGEPVLYDFNKLNKAKKGSYQWLADAIHDSMHTPE